MKDDIAHLNGVPSSDFENEKPALSELHRHYLLERHGTTELDPMPDGNDADPLNWPKTKKITVLLIVSFHAFMNTFSGAAVGSSFASIAEDLIVSIEAASYFVSIPILCIGIGPLFWCPLANRWGRRPVFLVSLVISLAANIGCARSQSYAGTAVCRAIVGFAISPACALGTVIVAEMFFKRERGTYMGVWAVMITLGVPIAPLVFGFVAFRAGYRWIYWILAITNGVQFLCHLFVGFETLYIRGETRPKNDGLMKRLISFRRINQERLSIMTFLQPLRFFFWRCVLLPSISYAMIFALANIFLSIEIGVLYVELLDFNQQQIGLQYICMIIGSLIGEVIGGILSDKWMLMKKKRSGAEPQAEFRLWLSYIAYALSIVGDAVFLVCIGQDNGSWSVSPNVGIAIAAVGNQVTTTVLITYAVDCYTSEAAAIGVFINFVRQVWGFIGPFWFPRMIEATGFRGSAGIIAALIIVVCFPASAVLQWRGLAWRRVVYSKADSEV